MRKIKNIFINLLGAALLAAGSAEAAMPWSTADFGGRNVTGEAFSSPQGNSVSFVSGPVGDTFVVWTRDSQALPGKEYDILAQRLANADGSKVWLSTLTVAAAVPQGAKGPGGSYFGGGGSGSFVAMYSDDASSNCYVSNFSSDSVKLWGPVQVNFDPAVYCAPKMTKAGNFGFVSFSTAIAGEPEQAFVKVINLATGNPAFTGPANGVAVPAGAGDSVPSLPGGSQVNPGAIFVTGDATLPILHAYRVDSTGAVNWSVSYTTIAVEADKLVVLEDGASGVYIVWTDVNTQDINAIRIDANGVLYPNWPFVIDTNMYLNSNHGGSGDKGAFYAIDTSSGVVVAWAEDGTNGADIHAALLNPDGTGVIWNNVVDTLTGGGTGNAILDGDNLTIAKSSRAVVIAYQYDNSAVLKALNAVVLDFAGQTLVAAQTVISGLPTNTSSHNAYAVQTAGNFIVGTLNTSSIYAQKIMVPASAVANHTHGVAENPVMETNNKDDGTGAAYGGGTFLVGYQYNVSDIGAKLVAINGTAGAEIALDPVTDFASGGAPIAAFDGTNFLLLWQCDITGYKGFIHGQRIDTTGNKVGSSFWISQMASNTNGREGVSFDGTNYFVVWSSGSPASMYGQFVSPAGALVNSPLLIATGARADEGGKAVDYGNGKHLVVWHVDDGNYGRIVKGRFVLPNGTMPDPEFVVDASNYPSDAPVGVVADDTKFLVVFHDKLSGVGSGMDTTGMHLYGKFVGADGTVAPSTFTISDSPGGQAIADLVWDGSKYLGIWNDAPFLSSGTVHMRYFDASGSPLSGDTVIASVLNGKAPLGLSLTKGPAGKFMMLINRASFGTGFEDPSMDLYSLFITTTVAPAAGTFSGNFSQVGGANFDGGNMDWSMGIALYNSNVYVVGVSSPNIGIIIKYDLSGNAIASATISGPFTGVAVNANGVYAAAQDESRGFVTAKYDYNLVLSSEAVLPGGASERGLALDVSGNVYIIGDNWGEPGNQKDYKLVKYDANLAQIGSPVLFDAGGWDEGTGIAVDNGNIYITGDSYLTDGATTFVTAKFDSTSMAFISSVAYANGYQGNVSISAEKLAVNPVTHDVYFVGASGTEGASDILTIKYSQNLQQLGMAAFAGADYDEGTDITLDNAGNVYALGKNQAFDGPDYAVLLKYDSSLVFLSSATRAYTNGYFPASIALDAATGNSYVTGIDQGADANNESLGNFRTVRFAPLPGAGASAGGTFGGNFSQASGATFDGGNFDAGTGAAFYGGSVYTVGVSSPSGVLLVKYDTAGNVVSSAVFTGGEIGTGIVANSSGVYITAQGAGPGFIVARYTLGLTFVSSATLPANSSARGLTFNVPNSIFVIGSWNNDYLLAKFSPALVFQSSASFDAGGNDEGRGIVYSSGSIYITGDTMLGDAIRLVTARYAANTLAFISSSVYSGVAYVDGAHPTGEKLAVNPVTYDLYLAASSIDRRMLTVRYSQGLAELRAAEFVIGSYSQGSDIKLDSSGNVYVAGPYNDGGNDYPVLVKYSPKLVFLSSAASAQTNGYEPAALALDPATGNSYVTGTYFATGDGETPSTWDMRTVRFGPQTAQLPVVYISSADVSPEVYLASQEAAALAIMPYTLSGSVAFTSLEIRVNPAGAYAKIASVALYKDDGDGVWNSQYDQLLSGGLVTSGTYYFDVPASLIDTEQTAYFVTLTPAMDATGSNLNVAVFSSSSFVTEGAMEQQAIYPIASAPKLVTYLAGITNLVARPGANLEQAEVYWHYPQDITLGHYIVRYSTNPADLSDPNVDVNRMVSTPDSGSTANSPGSEFFYTLPPVVTEDIRVFPQYFAVWLYNGVSTSAVSNLVQSLSFPSVAIRDQDATISTRTAMFAQYYNSNSLPGMYAQYVNGAKYARSAAGLFSALTFTSNTGEGTSFIALTTPDGAAHYYGDSAGLALKDLTADNAGNTYGLIQKGENSRSVVKFGPDGAVLWTQAISSEFTETLKALVYGAGSVYVATEYENGSNGRVFILRKLDAANGNNIAIMNSDNTPGVYNEVNSLAFTSDAAGGYLYAAGAAGQNPMTARLYKFVDRVSSISPAVDGSWPVQYFNPAGRDSRALVVKADSNDNLTVAGAEQRDDLSQGANIWLNRYNSYGGAVFSNPVRYNNSQSNADDIPTGLDFDSFGNIYLSGYTDMSNLNQGYNMLLAKFTPGGQFLSARIYDTGSGQYDMGMSVQISTDNYARVGGMFGANGEFGVYSMPLGAANAQFFSATEGPFTGSVNLTWNYTGRLPAGSSYRVQYSTDPAPAWNRAAAQIIVSTGPLSPGSVQSQLVGELTALRYPGMGNAGATANIDTRGNMYKFKVWITSGGFTTELPEAQTFAKTPSAYDNTQYYGRERLSFMSGLSGLASGIAVDSPYVYQGFAGFADGASAGFGLRKYNTDQYLEWTKFFNSRNNSLYNVNNMTRDAAGNFYLVGSQRPVSASATAPEYIVPGKNMWIAKLNSAGDLAWSYSVDASGIGQMDELSRVAVEGTSLYVVGVTSTDLHGFNILARKYDVSFTSPALLWSYTGNGAGNGDDFGYGIAVGTGAVYLSGSVFNTDKDIIVRALNKADGSTVGDAIVINSTYGDDEGYDLAVTTITAPAAIYVAGLVATSGTANEDAALFKYTLSGASVWANYYNGKASQDDAFQAVRLNASGVIVAGYESTVDQGKNSIYRKFDPAGALQWNRGFDFAAGGDDEASSLALDASGRVYSAVSLWDNNPGFYYFPEPSFALTAEQNYVPGSVRLNWMSQYEVPVDSIFAIQYSTRDLGVAWSTAAAQVWYTGDAAAMEGMNLSRVVYGLDSGRDAQGAPTASPYYFKVWFSTHTGIYAAVPGVASARASDGWAYENMVMYPNEARLFVMGDGQQNTAARGEKEFPGITRDSSGNLYTLANMNWNGNGGFAVKKFNSSLLPVWTKYYAPGEWFSVKANKMVADSGGNLYITGYERAYPDSTGKDLFVMKFGDSGVVWKSTYNFADGDDIGYGVAVDPSGNVYAAGSVNAGDGNMDILAAKFGPSGALLSTVTYSGSGSDPEAGYGIAVQGNNVYVTGSSDESGEGSSLWLGRFSASSLAAQDSPLKRSSDSVSGYEEAGYDVTVDSSGYVYVAGEMYNPEAGNNDAVVFKSSADLTQVNGLYPIRYNSPGNANDAAYGITMDAAGSVYVAGSQERYDINQDKNLWLRKYAQDGSELWSQEFNSSNLPGSTYGRGSSSDEGFNLAVGTMGFVSVSGKFAGYYGLYRYKQTSLLTVNPVLTVTVSSASCSSCTSSRFAGVGVALIPYSQTGGIDAASIRSSVTSPSGTASFQVPAGKQYFIALDKQGYSPNIKDQQMDPYGSYFVQLDADITKQYTLQPRPANDPFYPLTVTITSVTANDYVMAEVFFTRTGEKAAYGIAKVPVNKSTATFTVANVPPVDAGAYTLGITIPGRGLSLSVPMNALFPQTSSYIVDMSSAVATTGGFDVGASTTPPSVEGVVRSAQTRAPLEQVRVRMWNSSQNCSPGNPCMDYNVYETLTDVNGKYSFYNVVSTAAMYNLTAQKSGYKRAGSGVSIDESDESTVYREFLMEESTYSLRGIIRYRDVPVPNADVSVNGDYNWYQGGSDSYRGGRSMDSDARTKTGPDGSFVFSPAGFNALPDGQLRMNVSFFGTSMDLNQGNNQSNSADDVRIVISSDSATGVGNCAKGRVWKLLATSGACQSSGDLNFNIMPQGQNDYAMLSGSVTFITTYTVTEASPLVISSMAPVTVMVTQDCNGDCQNRSLGFALLSGTYTVNTAAYSITLSTGVSYYARINSDEWGETSSFNSRADFSSTSTLTMNFVVAKAGSLKGVVKMPDGSNYKPVYGGQQSHSMDIDVRGQNVNVSNSWKVDDYGAFEFPNLAPGLYTVTMKPQTQGNYGFPWAAPAMSDVAVVAGKTTQVTLKLENGLVVQPQIIGLPEISTPTWAYVIIPVESGTEMNQKKISEIFFGKDTFAFNYSSTTHTWDKKIMLTGQYDFYLMMGTRYNPENGNNEPLSFDQFGNFIGKVKGVAVQRVESTPNLGTDLQPIPVNILGSLGQDSFEGTILGERIYTDTDLDKVFSNMDELFTVIPAVMVYDAAGDLRGYTAGLPTGDDFPLFMDALQTKDKAIVKAYFAAHRSRFMVAGLPQGRYTVVFSNPNYPPISKDLTIPLAASYYGKYPFNFDEQVVRTGDIYGTVKSSVTGLGLSDAVVYLKHRTVEKFTNTLADGSYSFANLPPGIFRLEVTREGFVKAGQKTSLTGSLTTGSDRAQLDFSLTPSQSSMAGKVYLSKFPAPLTKSGVKIVAYDETYNTEHPVDYLPKIEVNTNDAGEYEIAGVVPGHNYKVSAFYGSKLPATLDVSSETVTEGVTYLPDIVLREVPPQITVKVRKSPDSVNKVDVTIKSPKQLVTTPACKVNPGEAYVSASAVSLALVPGPNNTYLGQFTVSHSQTFYNVHVAAGDGSNKMEKDVTYSPNNQAKTEQYIQDEAIQGGEIQMDKESEEYSGIELDTGGLSYSTYSATTSGISAFRTSASGDLVGGFFSALPSVRTVKTAKGDLNITQAMQDLMASEVYNMEIENASANKPFTLTLKYDKEVAGDNRNLRIYQYNDAAASWKEVPGNYTTDPMLGVLSVGVAGLTDASAGVSSANTPLGRKRFGMSAVVSGRYVPSAAGTSQSGRFAVFTANPPTGTAAFSSALEVYNMPNPFNLKSKSVTLSADLNGAAIANPYPTKGTVIKYNLPAGKSGNLKFVIYNMAGEKVRTINEGARTGGIYYSEWDGKNDTNQDCASGVYFMLTYVDGKKLGTKAHKMAIIK